MQAYNIRWMTLISVRYEQSIPGHDGVFRLNVEQLLGVPSSGRA
jgi:hypothetical protein